MKILVDTHTHTNASTHAYGSVLENLALAKQKGMEGVCMTNHAPALPDGAHLFHFQNCFELPESIDGVRLFKGIEANIMGLNGKLDISEGLQRRMDFIIASAHTPCYLPKNEKKCTQMWLNVIKNPYVSALGHSGRMKVQYDYETVIRAAKEAGKCIEINSYSFRSAKGIFAENCRQIASWCKKLGANIVVSSDAHTPFLIGEVSAAVEFLEEIEFPEEQIINLNLKRFEAYLEEQKGRRE